MCAAVAELGLKHIYAAARSRSLWRAPGGGGGPAGCPGRLRRPEQQWQHPASPRRRQRSGGRALGPQGLGGEALPLCLCSVPTSARQATPPCPLSPVGRCQVISASGGLGPPLHASASKRALTFPCPLPAASPPPPAPNPHPFPRAGWADVADALLGAGADVHIRNSKGWAAVQSAAHSGFFDIVLRLVQVRRRALHGALARAVVAAGGAAPGCLRQGGVVGIRGVRFWLAARLEGLACLGVGVRARCAAGAGRGSRGGAAPARHARAACAHSALAPAAPRAARRGVARQGRSRRGEAPLQEVELQVSREGAPAAGLASSRRAGRGGGPGFHKRWAPALGYKGSARLSRSCWAATSLFGCAWLSEREEKGLHPQNTCALAAGLATSRGGCGWQRRSTSGGGRRPRPRRGPAAAPARRPPTARLRRRPPMQPWQSCWQQRCRRR